MTYTGLKDRERANFKHSEPFQFSLHLFDSHLKDRERDNFSDSNFSDANLSDGGGRRMTREEAMKIIESNRPIYRDWQKEFDEALDRLKQPITLSEFLGWEESPDYCPQCGQATDWSEE